MDPLAEITLRETLLLLDEELSRLPERYRAPLVLCYLEGRSRDEAAKQLGWSLGTLKRRLEQARGRLHDCLVRRGLNLSSALAAMTLTRGEGPAAALLHTTSRAAGALAAGRAVSGVVSAQVMALAEGGLRTVTVTKLQLVAAFLMTLGVLATGSGLLTRTVRSEPRLPSVEDRAESEHRGEPLGTAKDLHGDDLPLGALARMGTVRLHHGGPALGVAFSTDGKWIVSGGGDSRTGYRDFTASLWDAATGKEQRRFERAYRAHFCGGHLRRRQNGRYRERGSDHSPVGRCHRPGIALS